MTNPLPPITGITNIDEVVDAIETIVQWSIDSASRLGYFAALYKRITIAIRTAIAENKFENGPRMERFDVTFASRYFAALNGHFHPGQFPAPTHSWSVAFNGALLPDPIIVQQMIAGVNAHIDLDLGIAAEEIAPGAQLPSLHNDFNTVNAVLASQVNGVLDEIDSLSPVLADIYDVLQKNEIDLIGDGLQVVRDSAWCFADKLAIEPPLLHPATIMVHDLEVAQLGTLILHPPGFLANVVKVIAASESRDVVHNVKVLDQMAARTARIGVMAT